MTKKQLKIFLILFIFCILGVSIFYLWDKGEQKETENQDVLNFEKISLVLLNSHSSPQTHSNWTVSFQTKGKADLTITPDDPGTINHLDFISLTCDGEERNAQILDNDIIFCPDWSCAGTGKVTHLVNIAGHHALVFQFGNQTAYAYNNPDAVTDTFDNTAKIYSKTNLAVSGGQVKLDLICGGKTQVKDAGGTAYPIVRIGEQCWMAKNLDYDNGCSSNGWENSTDTGWCGYYEGGPFTDEGLLYQWSAAMDGATTEGAQGICPDGWHIPSDDDWLELEIQICGYIGNSDCATTFTTTTDYRGDGEGSAMATSTALWGAGDLENDSDFGTSGLDVLPAGYRYFASGDYNARGNFAALWSSTELGSDAWRRYLNYDSTGINRYNLDKANGWSVRCLRD